MQSSMRKQIAVGRWSLPDVVGLGGAVAGLLAGAVMVVLSPILSLVTGIGIWEPPKLIAATLLGPAVAEQTGFVLLPVLVGTLIHFVTSLILGVIFGVVLNRMLHLTTDFGLPVLLGFVYGAMIFFVAWFIILPLINPTLRDSYMGPVIAQNLVFGVCLGLLYTMVRPRPYGVRR